MKLVDAYKLPAQLTALETIRRGQAASAMNYKARLSGSADAKLLQDLNDIFENYDPNHHLVGIKATYDYKVDFKDRHSKTVKYVAGNIVEDPKPFENTSTCGGGLHFSIANSPSSMQNSLMSKEEKGSRFHIALLNAKDTVLVGSDKFKVKSAEVVFTGSFKDCYRLLQALFGTLDTAKNLVK